MKQDKRSPSGPVDQAVADAALRMAQARLARMRAEGKEVHDEADFLVREVQQAFLDMQERGGATGT